MRKVEQSLSPEPTFRGKPLSRGMLIKYLGRKKDYLQFEIGKMVHTLDHSRDSANELSILKGRVRIRALQGFGVEIDVTGLKNPHLSYFGRTELTVDNPGMDIMIGIECDAFFKSADIKQEKIEVKIKDQ